MAVTLHPLSGYIGAEVRGLALTDTLTDDAAEEMRQALYRHQVLVFKAQHISLEQQKAFTSVFGPLTQSPLLKAMDGEPDVVAVLKEAEDVNVGVFGGDWHSDFSFLQKPLAGSVLSAQEIPPFGGDTMWASQIAAYELLPDDLKSQIEGRGVIHVGKPYGVKYAPPMHLRSSSAIGIVRGDPEADRETEHPIVRTHPESGRKALFVNPIYTNRMADMSEAESRPLLRKLYRHATRPDITCRHRWDAGDVVVWDNRVTLHYALNDYDGYRRLLYRTTFGDRV